MNEYNIYNLNLLVATVEADSQAEALAYYCRSRNIYDKENYTAEIKY